MIKRCCLTCEKHQCAAVEMSSGNDIHEKSCEDWKPEKVLLLQAMCKWLARECEKMADTLEHTPIYVTDNTSDAWFEAAELHAVGNKCELRGNTNDHA